MFIKAPDLNNEWLHTVIGFANDHPRKHCRVRCTNSQGPRPVLGGSNCRCVDDELISGFVECRCGLQVLEVGTVGQFGSAVGAYNVQVFDLLEPRLFL